MHGGKSGLFSRTALPDEAQRRTEQALRSVAVADINDLLARDIDVLVDEMVTPFDRATVRWDDVTMTEPTPAASTVTDVFGDRVRVPQTSTTFTVPVEGDSLLLTYWSHSGAPMGGVAGTVRNGSLQFAWTGDLGVNAEALRKWLDHRRSEVERFLAHNNNDVDGLNRQMRARVRTAIDGRRREELARRDLVGRLPFPIARRPEATRPVAVQRKQVRLQRSAPAPTFVPEPALEEAMYQDILADCISFATVFERTPSVEDMPEEEIRNLFLGMLNTNYTGQVAGELFNGAGKTDICIRADDRNVFIGECKLYHGPKAVAEAIDQLLGYLVWRDTKAALLLFVRTGNFTQAVERAVDAVRTHPQCQRTIPAQDPTRRSDYVFTRADDPSRAIRLALLPFQLRA